MQLAITPDNKQYDFIQHLTPESPVFRLSQKQFEILVDFAFNLGTLQTFPKFVDAVCRKDWKTAVKEYKRKYKRHGTWKDLTHRNEAFYNQFFK